MKTYWATAIATMLASFASQSADSTSAKVVPFIAKEQLVTDGPCSASWTNPGTGPGAYTFQGTMTVHQLQVTQSSATYTRCYILYVPTQAITNFNNKGQNAPMVILLHGGNTSYVDAIQPQANNNDRTGVASSVWITTADITSGSPSYGQSLADHYGIIVAVPNGTDDAVTNSATTFNAYYQHWNDCSGFNPGFTTTQPTTSLSNQLQLWVNGNFYPQTGTYNPVDDVAFINKMISAVNSNYPIDPTRIYAVGASDGGNMALRLAREDSGRIAAVAASLAGDGVQGTSPSANPPIGNYSTDQSRKSTDPQACGEPTDPTPVMFIKGVPAPDSYNPGDTADDTSGTNLASSGDEYIAFNGGCGADSSSNTIKANGCWLPFDATDQFALNGNQSYKNAIPQWPSGNFTTLGNWLHRNGLADTYGNLNSSATMGYVSITGSNADPNLYDGSANGASADSRVGGLYDSTGSTLTSGVPSGTCRDYYKASGSKANEVVYCPVYRNGHIDPSLAITAQNFYSYEYYFGNENQDFETATQQWNFLTRHTVDASGIHH